MPVTEGLDKDTQRLALIYGMGEAAQKNLEASEREAELQAKIQNSLGISGKLLGAVAKNFGGFGKAIGIDQVAKDMEKAAFNSIDILVVEDNPGDARLIMEVLK